MRALVIESDQANRSRRQSVLRHVPFGERNGECRIRVTCAGICGTDLELIRGYADYTGIPGHEFVGVVEDAPNRDRHWIGKRVVGEINVSCGVCDWCIKGVREHCPIRSVLGILNRDGAFATHVSLPAINLHALPDSLSDQAAVFVEPTAAACEILTQVDISRRTHVAVIGDGRLGLLIGQVLQSTGATVTQVGHHPGKLKLAESFGLSTALGKDAVVPKSFDLTVDATGHPAGLQRAIDLARPRGTVVMKSTFHGATPVELWPAVVDELTLIGSRCGPFERGIEMLVNRDVKTEPLLAGSYQMEAFEEAFALARTSLKVLLQP